MRAAFWAISFRLSGVREAERFLAFFRAHSLAVNLLFAIGHILLLAASIVYKNILLDFCACCKHNVYTAPRRARMELSMDQLTGILAGMDQEQGVVLLFTAILVFCVGTAGMAVVFRSLGKWGAFALMVGVAVVVVVWRLS